jgi:hypothetical protein
MGFRAFSTIIALGNIASAMAFLLFFVFKYSALAVPRDPVLFLTPTGYGL